MTDDVLHVMAEHENICNYIHLPVQSGSNAILDKMNRGYTKEWYKDRIKTIKKFIPDCGISSDFITGFCDESDQDHKETLSLMEWVKFDFAYMFKYSERPKTMAERKFSDNISEEIKSDRLKEIIALQQTHSLDKNKSHVNKVYRVLVEGFSKKSKDHLFGRNTQNTVIVFPKNNFSPGEYVNIKVNGCTSATLLGEAI